MMIPNSYSVLIFLSVIVIISYLFNLIARRWKFPSVLLLLGAGILLRYAGAFFGFELNNIRPYLELFGIVGLILIVLEAALEIKINPSTVVVAKRSLVTAFLLLFFGVIVIAAFFRLWFSIDWRTACLNAIPLAVISSAIVIPSIEHLEQRKKEFLIYESTLSDILGILLFNFLVQHTVVNISTAFYLIGNLILTIMLSVVSSLLLFYLIARIKDHVKIFIILSVMMIIYSFGKLWHLSPLLLIFVFGMLLSNFERFFKKHFASLMDELVKKEFSEFKLVIGESSFVIRTFFFVMFGYSINLVILADIEVLLIGTVVVCTLFLIRYLYLKFVAKMDVFPELFISPKGLVSILLFYSIPRESLIPSVSRGVLFFVICVSSIAMSVAFMTDNRKSLLNTGEK